MGDNHDDPHALEGLQIYSVIRAQIEHEDNLINARVIWMVISQSFLFTSFATALNSPAKTEDQFFPKLHTWLLWLVPGVGIALSCLVGISILSSLHRLRATRDFFAHYPTDKRNDRFPPIESTTLHDSIGPVPPVTIPVVFILAWGALLLQHAFE
jgi:hypothetical protein